MTTVKEQVTKTKQRKSSRDKIPNNQETRKENHQYWKEKRK